jgi:hypothetical protein
MMASAKQRGRCDAVRRVDKRAAHPEEPVLAMSEKATQEKASAMTR